MVFSDCAVNEKYDDKFSNKVCGVDSVTSDNKYF